MTAPFVLGITILTIAVLVAIAAHVSEREWPLWAKGAAFTFAILAFVWLWWAASQGAAR